jgi:hypothetical protein
MGSVPGWSAPVTLYAGQTNPVGNVTVVSDGTNLNVTYTMENGYLLTAAHLSVGCGQSSIPVNNAGNPVPGLFPFAGAWNPGVVTQTFQIPLTDSHLAGCHTVGAAVIVAAQAEVQTAQYIVSGSSPVMVTRRRGGEDPLPFADPSHAVTPFPAVLAWRPCSVPVCPGGNANPDQTPYPSLWDTSLLPSGSGAFFHDHHAEWIWEAYHPLDPVEGNVVRMEATVTVPSATAGSLIFAADNGAQAYLNGVQFGITPTLHTYNGIDWKDSELSDNWVNTMGWQHVQTFQGNLVAGANTFAIDVPNEEYDTDDGTHAMPGTIVLNPTGVIFLFTAGYGGSDTAWGTGTRIASRGNWATYFTYTLALP